MCLGMGICKWGKTGPFSRDRETPQTLKQPFCCPWNLSWKGLGGRTRQSENQLLHDLPGTFQAERHTGQHRWLLSQGTHSTWSATQILQCLCPAHPWVHQVHRNLYFKLSIFIFLNWQIWKLCGSAFLSAQNFTKQHTVTLYRLPGSLALAVIIVVRF